MEAAPALLYTAVPLVPTAADRMQQKLTVHFASSSRCFLHTHSLLSSCSTEPYEPYDSFTIRRVGCRGRRPRLQVEEALLLRAACRRSTTRAATIECCFCCRWLAAIVQHAAHLLPPPAAAAAAAPAPCAIACMLLLGWEQRTRQRRNGHQQDPASDI